MRDVRCAAISAKSKSEDASPAELMVTARPATVRASVAEPRARFLVEFLSRGGVSRRNADYHSGTQTEIVMGRAAGRAKSCINWLRQHRRYIAQIGIALGCRFLLPIHLQHR